MDKAHLTVFIYGMHSSLCVKEEISMHATSGNYVFENVRQSIIDIKLSWNKPVGLTTDDAPAMCSEKLNWWEGCRQ